MANPSASGHRSATGDYRAGVTTSSRRAIHAGVSPGPRRRFERARLATAKPRPPISREREERPVGGAAFGTGSADHSGPSPDRTSASRKSDRRHRLAQPNSPTHRSRSDSEPTAGDPGKASRATAACRCPSSPARTPRPVSALTAKRLWDPLRTARRSQHRFGRRRPAARTADVEWYRPRPSFQLLVIVGQIEIVDDGLEVRRAELELQRLSFAARGPLDEVLRRPVDAGNTDGGIA